MQCKRMILLMYIIDVKEEYNAQIENIEDKISNITNFASYTTLNAKINEVNIKVCSITNLTELN